MINRRRDEFPFDTPPPSGESRPASSRPLAAGRNRSNLVFSLARLVSRSTPFGSFFGRLVARGEQVLKDWAKSGRR